MKIYGLTGKTGAGKSTVALLLEKKGYYIIDGDVAAREITRKNSPVLSLLSRAFGNDIILPDGELDRKKLVAKTQEVKDGMRLLNSITHPAIDEIIREELKKAEREGFELCVIDAAALLESPSRAHCEKMIVVTAPEKLRAERIAARDSISPEQIMQRMAMQRDDEYYLSNADIIIRNYPPYVLSEEIEKIG